MVGAVFSMSYSPEMMIIQGCVVAKIEISGKIDDNIENLRETDEN